MFGFGPVEIGILLLMVVPFYFAPSLVAKGKRHPKLAGIFVLNLLLGWTILIWIACLSWAFAGGKKVVHQK